MSETFELTVATVNGERYVSVSELLVLLREEYQELRALRTPVSEAQADYINDLTVRLATIRRLSDGA